MRYGYWAATAAVCLIMLFSAGMYVFNHEMVAGVFTHLGFPTWIIYPLAVAKVLGVVAILTRKSALLKEWAYAGIFFDTLLATGAHLAAGDGLLGAAPVICVLTLVSRYLEPHRDAKG